MNSKNRKIVYADRSQKTWRLGGREGSTERGTVGFSGVVKVFFAVPGWPYVGSIHW
jgi:hypothetical protein